MGKRSLLAGLLAIVVGVWGFVPCVAQEADLEVVELSLDEALRMALKNNLDLVSARYAPKLSEQEVNVQRAAFDASFQAFADHSEQQQPPLQLSSVTGSDADTFNAGVTQNLPLGANYTLGFQALKQTQDAPNVVAPASWFSTVSAQFTLPLLRGFGTRVTTEQLVLARNNYDISITDLEGQAENTLETVEGAYWDVVAGREALRIALLALARAEDLLELNRKKVEVGTLAPIEITQAEAGVASREEEVIVAEVNLWDAEDELRRLLGIPQSDPMWDMEIHNATRPVFREMAIDLEDSIQLAMASRPEVYSAEQTLQNRMLEERVAKRQVRHQLDFNVNYAPTGFSLGAPGIETASAERALARMFNGDAFNWNVRLTYRVPIGNRAAKADYAVSRLTREQAQVDLKNQEQTVRVEVRRAVRGVDSGIKRVQAARKNVELQQKKLDAEQKKFENGMSTSFEVLTFQNDLADAELSEIRARLDYIKSLAALERAKGTLLESRGLSLGD